MKINEQLIGAEQLDLVSANETLIVYIKKNFGPELWLEDDSVLIFESLTQFYPSTTKYISYSPERVIDMDKFDSDTTHEYDDVSGEYYYRTKKIYGITVYEFSGKKVYRLHL